MNNVYFKNTVVFLDWNARYGIAVLIFVLHNDTIEIQLQNISMEVFHGTIFYQHVKGIKCSRIEAAEKELIAPFPCGALSGIIERDT